MLGRDVRSLKKEICFVWVTDRELFLFCISCRKKIEIPQAALVPEICEAFFPAIYFFGGNPPSRGTSCWVAHQLRFASFRGWPLWLLPNWHFGMLLLFFWARTLLWSFHSRFFRGNILLLVACVVMWQLPCPCESSFFWLIRGRKEIQMIQWDWASFHQSITWMLTTHLERQADRY